MSGVVVVGGGVIGCAIAERLTRAGHQVRLFERDRLAGHASGAAAGELTPESPEPRIEELARRSLAMFPELIERIEKDSAVNVEYHRQEGLRPAFTEEEAKGLRRPGARWLDATECRGLEPELSPDVIGALLVEHAHLTPPRYVLALARAAARRGAEICEGTPVTGFELAGGRVRRVQTSAGRTETDWVVIAAGAWTKDVASKLDVEVDVRPQRGQIAALDPGAVAPTRAIFWSKGYLVPKSDGTVIAGGTEEDAGFDERPSVDGIASLLDLARRLVPRLGTARLERVWAGLRPVMPDRLPLIAVSAIPNVVIATGHHRKGLSLSPLTAAMVAEMIES